MLVFSAFFHRRLRNRSGDRNEGSPGDVRGGDGEKQLHQSGKTAVVPLALKNVFQTLAEAEGAHRTAPAIRFRSNDG